MKICNLFHCQCRINLQENTSTTKETKTLIHTHGPEVTHGLHVNQLMCSIDNVFKFAIEIHFIHSHPLMRLLFQIKN